MEDIQNRQDIELLVDSFYERVLSDDLIGFFFKEVVALDWKVHIPIMYDFWESILLGVAKYKGNPPLKHIELSKKEPLTTEHFDRWLTLWQMTIQENFKGAKATEAIERANQIGILMKFKLEQHKKA